MSDETNDVLTTCWVKKCGLAPLSAARNRNGIVKVSDAKSQFCGLKCDRRIFCEEVLGEIAILRSPEKFSGRSGKRPESVSGGSIGWNRDSPVLTPFGDYNIKREDGGTGESRSHPILPPKHSLVAFLSDRRIPGLVSATLYQGPGA